MFSIKDPKIHLIAKFNYDIQMDEDLQLKGYIQDILKFLSYIPIVTFMQ